MAAPDGGTKSPVKTRPPIKRRTTTAAQALPVPAADDLDYEDNVIQLPVKPDVRLKSNGTTQKASQKQSTLKSSSVTRVAAADVTTTTSSSGRRQTPRIQRARTTVSGTDKQIGVLRQATKTQLSTLMSSGSAHAQNSSAACAIL